MCDHTCRYDADRIIDRACDTLLVSRQVLVGRRRTQPLALWRQFVMWQIRANTCLSYPQVGRLFGRDHTTVLHAVTQINEALADGHPDVHALFDQLTVHEEVPVGV